MNVRFGVLGPLRIDGGGRPPGPAKHRALLAALLLSAGEQVPVERLMSVIWDDRPPALRALGALRESLAAYQDLSDPRGEAEALLDLARLHLAAGRPAQARDCAERRLSVNRRLGDRLPEAAALLVLAGIAEAEGDPDAAARAASAALETFTSYGDHRGTAQARLALARAALALDDIEGAVVALTRSMEEFDRLGDAQGRAGAERLAQEARRRRGQRI